MPEGRTEKNNPVGWCRTCGSAHVGSAHCPGILKLTGRNEKVWESPFVTAGGETMFFVTLTAWSDRWCARIYTQPNIPWSIPGGGTAIKFLSPTREECQAAAMRFLTDFCRRKGYARRGEEPAGDSAPDQPARVTRSIPVVWGEGTPSNPGASLNVSATGMFVATETPPEPGSTIRLRLVMGALSLPLRGRVTWKRAAPDPARSLEAGMGIHLLSPPSIYKSYVRQFV